MAVAVTVASSRGGHARAGRPGPWQHGWQWHQRCHLASSEHPRSWWVRAGEGPWTSPS